MSAPAPLGAYLAIPVLAVLAIAVVLGALVTVRAITRWLNHLPTPATKTSTYECGEEPIGTAWFRLNPRFITIALLFIVFDVELALLWPILPRVTEWLGAGQAVPVAVKLGTFVGTLFLALVYAWVKGDLEWSRERPGVHPLRQRGTP